MVVSARQRVLAFGVVRGTVRRLTPKGRRLLEGRPRPKVGREIQRRRLGGRLLLAGLSALVVAWCIPSGATAAEWPLIAVDGNGKRTTCRLIMNSSAHAASKTTANVYWQTDLRCDRPLYYAEVRPTLRWIQGSLREDSEPERVKCYLYGYLSFPPTPTCGMSMGTGGTCQGCSAPETYKHRAELVLNLNDTSRPPLEPIPQVGDPWVVYPPGCRPGGGTVTPYDPMSTLLFCEVEQLIQAFPRT